ncbi:MAG: twin-arginine translocase TatA/TatE family subunit [Thermoleophilia bacterium]
MGEFSWVHLVIVLGIALVIFGPKKLPEMGRSLGKGIREFKQATAGLGEELRGEVHEQPAGAASAVSVAQPESAPVVSVGSTGETPILESPVVAAHIAASTVDGDLPITAVAAVTEPAPVIVDAQGNVYELSASAEAGPASSSLDVASPAESSPIDRTGSLSS